MFNAAKRLTALNTVFNGGKRLPVVNMVFNSAKRLPTLNTKFNTDKHFSTWFAFPTPQLRLRQPGDPLVRFSTPRWHRLSVGMTAGYARTGKS